MTSLPNPPTNGNVPLRERVRKPYQRIPDPDSETIDPAIELISEAARAHFRQCFAVRYQNHYEESYGRFELMVKLAVDKAIRAEWERCNEFAQQIADDAVRRAYALEIQS